MIYFSPDSPTEVTCGRIFMHNGSRKVPFGGLHDGRQHLGGKISQKPSKRSLLKRF